MHKIITLIGFPGSGKSTLGGKLAEAMSLPFFDLDLLIEKKEALAIADIFNLKGEKYFRELESKVLKNSLQKLGPCVLALGGGTPCFFDNMQWINEHSCSIYLDIPLKRIMERLDPADIEKRPLFRGLESENAQKEFEERFGWRREFYNKAKIKLKEDTANVDTILFELAKKG